MRERGPVENYSPRRPTRSPRTSRSSWFRVRGFANTTQVFRDKVLQIAARLEANPNFLMAVMSFESRRDVQPIGEEPGRQRSGRPDPVHACNGAWTRDDDRRTGGDDGRGAARFCSRNTSSRSKAA